MSLTLDGAIDQTPVAIRVSSGQVIDFLRVRDYVPFALSAEAAGAQLELKGRVTLPISNRSGGLRLQVKGDRLDSLSKLARVELPPWGPWSFGGSFRARPSGYEVPDLQVRMGSSSLNGHGSSNLTGARPRAGRLAQRAARATRRFPVRRLVAVREEGEEAGQADDRRGNARDAPGRAQRRCRSC